MQKNTLNLFPLFGREAPAYSWSAFRKDFIAALSIALVALPQAMAYAFVAELPMTAGIFCAIFGTILTASFGSSRYLVSGPTNGVAILMQSGIATILATYYPNLTGAAKETLALAIAVQITFFAGILQLLGGILQLGRIPQFISRSVIVGYSTVAAITIIITQLFYFFGVPASMETDHLYQDVIHFFTHMGALQISSTILGLGSLALLLFFHFAFPKIPGPAIVFFLAIVIAWYFPQIPQIEDIGEVYSELPTISFPFFDIRLIGRFLPLAFAIALLSTVEATAIGRSYITSHDPPYSENQEMYGLGVSNMVTSFLGAMPSSGSFSRTALNKIVGAETRFAAIFSGAVVLIIVLALGFWVTKIPLASLSALMLLTAYTMIQWKDLKVCLRATFSDAAVVLITCISGIFFNLETALYIGVVLSVLLYLPKAATPGIVEYAFNNVGKLRPLDKGESRPDSRISILQLEGDLFFGSAEVLQTSLRQLVEDENSKVIILQVFNVRHIDASACLVLKQFHKLLIQKKGFLLLSGVTPPVEKVLKDANIIEKVGKIFPFNEQAPSQATREAYAYAKEHLTK